MSDLTFESDPVSSESTSASVVAVEFPDSFLIVLGDGRKVSVPLLGYPRLLGATLKQLKNWKLIKQGAELRWKKLRENIPVGTLISPIESTPISVVAVEFPDNLWIVLGDNRKLSVPLSWHPSLMGATLEKLRDCRLIECGASLKWDKLDVSIPVENLISKPNITKKKIIQNSLLDQYHFLRNRIPSVAVGATLGGLVLAFLGPVDLILKPGIVISALKSIFTFDTFRFTAFCALICVGLSPHFKRSRSMLITLYDACITGISFLMTIGFIAMVLHHLFEDAKYSFASDFKNFLSFSIPITLVFVVIGPVIASGISRDISLGFKLVTSICFIVIAYVILFI